MEHLIADTGLQFFVTETEFNPSEPLTLESMKTLKYSFCEIEDIFEESKIFDILYHDVSADRYIPLSELLSSKESLVHRSSGRREIDEMGMVIVKPEANTVMFTSYPDGQKGCYGINSLHSFLVKDPVDGRTTIPAFDLLLDKWLPMPMFYKAEDGVTANVPLAWCRVKISVVGPAEKKGVFKYRFVWAFDTQLTQNPDSKLRPFIEEGINHVDFTLCNQVDLLLGFMGSAPGFHAFSDYIASICGIDTKKDSSLKYKAFYIYLINFIRLLGAAPEIRLYNKPNEVDVDLVLDIGNSRTCGILFENGEFTKGQMLALRDLTLPEVIYENKTFDMRVVFRRADFGNDIVLPGEQPGSEPEEMFQWKSFVRIGDEARHLIYCSLEDEGLSKTATNYSSPKRYLWDKKSFDGKWENLVINTDPYNVAHGKEIYIKGLSDLFDNTGAYVGQSDSLDLDSLLETHHPYSRSALMTFAFVEIFLHAVQQINSIAYRDKWASIDLRRRLRNIIITCPTAMPVSEQVTLRKAAADAFEAVRTVFGGNLPAATILPDPDALASTDPNKRVWTYDEASCCQLVYLYAEIAKRYSGEIHRFFELKGHRRPDLAEEGYEGKSLTIGTVDIGAGTTDLMICAYQYEGEGRSRIEPVPLFWDSFYLAGDDILRNLVQNVVIEGRDYQRPDMGNITSALTARMLAMSDSELEALPCLADSTVYRAKVSDIILTTDTNEKNTKKIEFASNLIHDFFGADSAMMGYRDRRCRNDFNTQISVPLAQKMMDLLRLHRPTKLYTYDEIFEGIKPAEYLLNYFEHHFGFRFEELNWRFDPVEIGDIVKTTMEPLLRQLALVLYSKQCDIVVLAGRPTSLDPITELFIKYLPTSPDRLVRLNEYRVGNWFPTADGQGYFYDQKAIVAVGGMVGFLASRNKLNGLTMDFSKMVKNMHSTANFIGDYNSRRQKVNEALITPIASSATFSFSVFPAYIGCRTLDSAAYQARPLYAVYNYGAHGTLRIIVSRNFHEDPEKLVIEDILDSEGNSVPRKYVELVQQSIDADGSYWLDKGEFELIVR